MESLQYFKDINNKNWSLFFNFVCEKVDQVFFTRLENSQNRSVITK